MNEVLAQRSPSPAGRVAGIVTIGGIGVVVGLLALAVGDVSAAWFVYLIGGVMFALVILSVPHPRRLVLGMTILSFQVNVKMYFFYRGGSTWVGASGPVGLELPLCALLAIVLLGMEASGLDTDAGGVVMPGRLMRPVLYYLGAILLSGLATSERFLWLCYVNQQILSIVILVAVANAIRDEGDVGLVVSCFLVCAAIQPLAYFAETATGMKFNPEGDFASLVNSVKGHGGMFHSRSNGLAAMLVPLVVLALSQFLQRQQDRGRLLPGLALGLGASGLIATMARAGWIGCALGGVFVVWMGARRKLLSSSHLAVCLVGGSVVALVFAHSLVDRFGSDHSRDYEERRALMQMAWNVFAAHPVIGSGAGSYAQVFRNYLTSDLSGRWVYLVHNRFLLTAAEMGVVGIVAFVGIFVAWWREAYGLVRESSGRVQMLGVGLCGAVVGLVWHLYWDTLTGFPIDGVIYGLMGLTVGVRALADRKAA